MKKKKIIIKLISNSGSKHFYTKFKNKNNKKNLILKKFDPVIKKHVLYKEIKNK